MPPHHRRAAPPTLLFHLRLGTPRDVSPSPRPVLTARLSYPYRRSSRSTWTRTGATRRCTSPKKPSAPSDGTPSCRRAERRSLTHRRSRAMSTQTETQPRARPPQLRRRLRQAHARRRRPRPRSQSRKGCRGVPSGGCRDLKDDPGRGARTQRLGRGKFIFIIVCAISMTSCFEHRGACPWHCEVRLFLFLAPYGQLD